MYHAALEIKTETMTHMHSRKGYTTLGKVNWVGQLHCFVPFLPITNPFSSSSFVFFSHHHSLVFTRIAATLFLSHSSLLLHLVLQKYTQVAKNTSKFLMLQSVDITIK